MTDSLTTESSLFEVLAGLPGDGPHPEQFTATGGGTQSEGFVVRFLPRTPSTWIGNFQPGWTNYNAVLIHPDTRTLIVVSGGQGYHIDPETRAVLGIFSNTICDALYDPILELLVFSDGIRLEALGTKEVLWTSERISWDGIRGLTIEGLVVAGEAYEPMSGSWSRFSVDLLSGEINGGSYRSSLQ
jgi:hypothetical protein